MSTSGGDPASNLPGLLANLGADHASHGQTASHQSSAQGADPQSYSEAIATPSSPTPHTQSQTPHQSGAMSPDFSSAFAPPRSRASGVNTNASRNTTPARTPAPLVAQSTSGQMTNPLLNLLKFGSNTASTQVSPQQQPAVASRPEYGSASTHSVHGRGISASDLVASFTGGKAATPTQREKIPATSSISHQDALLRLLNQTTSRADAAQQKQSGSTDAATNQLTEDLAGSSLEDQHQSVLDTKSSVSGRNESPIRFFGSNENTTPTPFEPQDIPKAEPSQKTGPIFTYVNPFENLAASSPRGVNPRVPPNVDIHKRKIKSSSPAAVHASSRRKLTTPANDILQSIETPTPPPLDDGRNEIEALMGIGAPSKDAETVAQALNDVGSQVDRQVESALAKVEGKTEEKRREADIKQEEREDAEQASLVGLVHDAAIEVKKELDKAENQGALEESMPASMAEAVKEIIDQAAQGKGADEWESAEGEGNAAKATPNRVVQVHQFPMRPFVSIDLIQKQPATLPIREDSVVNIARFKKDFDQADRVLGTATNEYIVYGMPKNGGIRVIQQDNGNSSLIYAKTQDRIFNIGISSAHPGSPTRGTQTVIATGVSGTVYWTTIARPGEEITQDDMEKQGLIIPPVPNQLDSTSGGQLKTRAKKSSRHPEFFAIGRGKSIYIVLTAHAQQSSLVNKEAVLDTERYFAERNLKVTTGKAGKDFTFSEDDTTIVTLDKAGKLRIWDIRELTDEANAGASMITSIEVKAPMLSFSTAHSSEKSWPTSVLFVDKLRPYSKGTALRYIIVGMKQNHTLQLWDLCLGKAVQELSFPHEKETDAICSVTYHPASGIITVGHPTRNSIYFIHLSAPKYNLPGMSQAKFVQRLANKDSSLPKAEATAIMSGMREYSFECKGQLRSVELVPSSGEPARAVDDDEDPLLFELYVMHSKGVTCLGIKKEDLGWSDDSRVLHPIDAEQAGEIVVKELREPSGSEPSSASINGDAAANPSPAKPKGPPKEAVKSERAAAEDGQAAHNTAEKVDKKKSKRNGAVEPVSRPAPPSPAPESYATAAQRASTPTPQVAPSITKETARPSMPKDVSREAPKTVSASPKESSTRPIANGDSISLGISGDFLDKELKKIEIGVSAEFNKVFRRELETLYRRFAEDKRVQDAAGAAKQDAMLRLVSSTLSDNVEKSLSRIVQKTIQDAVVPSVADVTSASLKDVLSTVVAKHVSEIMPSAMKSTLPEAIGRSMQNPSLLRSISEHITKTVTGHVEREWTTTLHNTIVPTFTDLAVTVAQKVSGDTERRVREQLQQAEVQHHNDSVKIDQLTDLVRGLSATMQTMAAAQSDFQLEILKLQQKAAQEGQNLAHRSSPTPSESASMRMSPEQEELEAIATSMHAGHFEEATVMWLQSGQQVALFDNLFVRCNPGYLGQASPLVVLSVGAAVTASLATNVMERLSWLETVFRSVNPRDPEIRDVAGKILEVLNQRLEGEYMRINEEEPQSPALRKIFALARRARELKSYSQ
ncbi:hypothetical protein IMSHALPRED_007763 [Imshaugia aleurites]|uniref:EDC4-like protein pdc1 beta-propeller domain-containing protein n=1 Tax=Imshaugia aleurites TaxID=172621 RepID=A0A8H3FRX2_9LECA|nr:hypothetical protein IMSHALPRED_007763 [Imshaugia aleurites]